MAAIAAVQQQQRSYVAAADGAAAAVLPLPNSHKNPSCHVNCVAVMSAAAVVGCRQPVAAAEAQT